MEESLTSKSVEIPLWQSFPWREKEREKKNIIFDSSTNCWWELFKLGSNLRGLEWLARSGRVGPGFGRPEPS